MYVAVEAVLQAAGRSMRDLTSEVVALGEEPLTLADVEHEAGIRRDTVLAAIADRPDVAALFEPRAGTWELPRWRVGELLGLLDQGGPLPLVAAGCG